MSAAMEVLLTTVPCASISRGMNAFVTVVTAQKFPSNNYFPADTSTSVMGML